LQLLKRERAEQNNDMQRRSAVLCMWLLATIYKRKEREWGVRRFGRGEDGGEAWVYTQAEVTKA